jgi:CubicO group peptidase (beta-lactamase class C family)
MVRSRSVWFTVALAITVSGLMAQVVHQGPSPEGKARIDAFFAALSSQNPDDFESYAQKAFAPEVLAKRSPADRRKLHQQLHKELGTMTLDRVERKNGTVTLVVRGATGFTARLELDVAPAPPYQFTRLSIAITDGGPGEGDGAPPPAALRGSMAPSELAAVIDGHVQAAVAKDGFSGVVLVAREGTVVFEKAYGLANRTFNVPNTIETRFNLASIGKAFTRAALAQLVSQGRVALSDTVGKLLPDYPTEPTRAATVEQLLGHEAGIADFFGPTFSERSKDAFRSNADYFRFVSTQPALFAPGAKRQYCNGCYIVLGAIIERLSGTTYEAYVAEHVFARAGMRHAGFLRTDELAPNVANGYTRNLPYAKGELRSNIFAHGTAGSAAGGSYATASDLLAFDNALRAQRLLDAKMTAWFLNVERAESPRASGRFQIAGGAPGVNTMLASRGTWTVIVVANVDPPAAGRLAEPIMTALAS